MRRGLCIGRFLPLHRGHELLLRTGLNRVERMTVLLCAQPNDPIPSPIRMAWLEALSPDLQVASIEAALPPKSHDLEALARAIRQAEPEPIDALFGSAAYLIPLAERLEAQPVMVDPGHEIYPARSAALLAEPFAHWRFLAEVARPQFVKRITLIGPESSGKSTLAQRLAQRFNTAFMPEYGRTFETQHMVGKSYQPADLVRLAKTHVAIRRALERRANRLLIEDTDPLITAVWSDMLCSTRDPWFAAFDEVADLYLLTDLDKAFVQDGIRYFGDKVARQRFMDLCQAELDRRALPHVKLSGSWQAREARAVAAIEQRFAVKAER